MTLPDWNHTTSSSKSSTDHCHANIVEHDIQLGMDAKPQWQLNLWQDCIYHQLRNIHDSNIESITIKQLNVMLCISSSDDAACVCRKKQNQYVLMFSGCGCFNAAVIHFLHMLFAVQKNNSDVLVYSQTHHEQRGRKCATCRNATAQQEKRAWRE